LRQGLHWYTESLNLFSDLSPGILSKMGVAQLSDGGRSNDSICIRDSLHYSGKRTWVDVPDSTKVVCSGVEGAG
jgi:hypothetical protein